MNTRRAFLWIAWFSALATGCVQSPLAVKSSPTRNFPVTWDGRTEASSKQPSSTTQPATVQASPAGTPAVAPTSKGNMPGHAREVDMLGASLTTFNVHDSLEPQGSWALAFSASRHAVGYRGALTGRMDQHVDLGRFARQPVDT